MSDWKTLVREDREAVLARDPAAKSMAEVRLWDFSATSPG